MKFMITFSFLCASLVAGHEARIKSDEMRSILKLCPAFSQMEGSRIDRLLDILDLGELPDGSIYLVTENANRMALWYRPMNGSWECEKDNVLIKKVEGGMRGMLPVRYVGRGRFLIAETSESKGPDFKCKTILIGQKRVIATSDGYAYKSVPYILVPANWFKLYEIEKTEEDRFFEK